MYFSSFEAGNCVSNSSFKRRKIELLQGHSVDVVRTSTGYISAYANNLRARKRNIIQFHIDSMYKYMWKKNLTENNTDRPKSEKT